MTTEVFYKRVVSPKGRVKYVPVREYDDKLMDAFTEGSHLVISYPGGKSRRYDIDPAHAPMIAAGRVAEDAISRAVMAASELRRSYKLRQKPLTPEQKAAWEHLVDVFGDEAKALEWPSAREVAEEGVKAMIVEAEKLMTNEGVRQAYEHFMLLCKLTKEP
jgi:hypothetical protein